MKQYQKRVRPFNHFRARRISYRRQLIKCQLQVVLDREQEIAKEALKTGDKVCTCASSL